MALDITTRQTDERGVEVLVEGEVDVSCASELRDAIDDALAGGATALTVDLAQVPYIDSTGIGVLVGAAHRAQEAGVAFGVDRPQRNVRRVLDMLGVIADLGVSAQDI